MFEIRKAVPEDALGIAIVNVYTWKTAYTGLLPEEVLDARISGLLERAESCLADLRQNGSFFVAADGRSVVGFCRYGESRNSAYPDAGEIYALYVLKGYQGLGAGKALFSTAAAALSGEGCRSMILNCLNGNPSLGFYEHRGGKIVAQRTEEIKGKNVAENVLFFKL